MRMGTTRLQKYFSTTKSAANLHMHYLAGSALHVMQSQSNIPVINKFNLSFDSPIDLLSTLELSVSQSPATIYSGFISVYKNSAT